MPDLCPGGPHATTTMNTASKGVGLGFTCAGVVAALLNLAPYRTTLVAYGGHGFEGM